MINYTAYRRNYYTNRCQSPYKACIIHRITNVTPMYKKGWKEDPGNYRPASLISVPGKTVEGFILSVLTGHVKDN